MSSRPLSNRSYNECVLSNVSEEDHQHITALRAKFTNQELIALFATSQFLGSKCHIGASLIPLRSALCIFLWNALYYPVNAKN